MHPPNPKPFEKAAFILNDNAVAEGITDEALLKEAQKPIHTGERSKKKRYLYLYGAVWPAGSALLTGLIWLSMLLLRLRNSLVCDTIPHIVAGGAALPAWKFPVRMKCLHCKWRDRNEKSGIFCPVAGATDRYKRPKDGEENN